MITYDSQFRQKLKKKFSFQIYVPIRWTPWCNFVAFNWNNTHNKVYKLPR